MNKELQKTMCEQLPYGTLKFWDEENPEYIPTLIGIPNNEMLRFSLPRFPGNIDLSNSELKPILRRMDLTKPITHKGYNDGKPFMPLDRLSETLRRNVDIFSLPHYLDFKYTDIEKLNEWHFNWRNIPDELVKYTDEFDYEIY